MIAPTKEPEAPPETRRPSALDLRLAAHDAALRMSLAHLQWAGARGEGADDLRLAVTDAHARLMAALLELEARAYEAPDGRIARKRGTVAGVAGRIPAKGRTG